MKAEYPSNDLLEKYKLTFSTAMEAQRLEADIETDLRQVNVMNLQMQELRASLKKLDDKGDLVEHSSKGNEEKKLKKLRVKVQSLRRDEDEISSKVQILASPLELTP